ncbi:hypothetical protein A9Q76_08570 [Arcobacter sp. 31_11_sub10_T18]|nr:hypothetical protein A9Q76_08570 [Arcobacter sp. 31_11_sub10_T18]
MKFTHLPLVALLLTLLSSSLSAEKLALYTEEFPPFNYSEKGKIVGVSTEIVEAVMKRAGLEHSIKSLPWARTYKMSQAKTNSFIYSISRRAKRENLFQWVGIITPATQSIFALSNRADVRINALEDLNKYKVGTTVEDSREAYLASKGFDVEKFQRVAGDSAYVLNYKKLKKKRIDVMPMPDAVMSHISKQQGDNPSTVLKKVFPLKEISQGGYYLAASLSTPKDTVEKVKVALESFKKTNEYKMILKKWGL